MESFMDAAGASPGPADAGVADDAPLREFSVTLLDVGRKEYGDCILVRAGQDSILVDGSHPGDDKGSFSIPRQLRYLLGQPSGTIRVSLLVVTHAHSDHYGCLPEMVRDGTLTADYALVADPALGWGDVPGDGEDGDAPAMEDALAAAHPTARRLALALREELPAPTDTGALRELMDAVDGARERYESMLERLHKDGCTVVRYGVDAPEPIVERFAPMGFRILGPSRTQLVACAQVIREATREALERATRRLTQDDAPDEVSVLVEMLAAEELRDTGRQKGAALNDQSIVLQVEIDGKKALLTGDMQLVDPELEEIREEMEQLRGQIRDGRPYAFFKVGHHASTDSFDAAMLADVIDGDRAPLLGISTGTEGQAHPSRAALNVLKDASAVTWARTDRNGQIVFRFTPDGDSVKPRRGELNDSTPKAKPQTDEGSPELLSDAAVAAAGGRVDGRADHAAGAGERIEVTTPGGVRIVVEIPR